MRSNLTGWSLVSSVVLFGCSTAPQSENGGSPSDQGALRDGGAGADDADGGAKPSHPTGAGADGSAPPGGGTDDGSGGAHASGEGSGLNPSEDEGSGLDSGIDDGAGDESTASTDGGDHGSTSAESESTNDVLTHRCEDGNDVAGDGCGLDGVIEPGYTCVTPGCESEPCTIEIAATYRDFSESDPDFGFDYSSGCGVAEGDPVPQGSVATQLDAAGLPVLARPDASACITSAESFASWYRSGVKKETTLRLYSNGQGGFVNRFGANGEQLVVTQATRDERQVSGECDTGCVERVRSMLQCESLCRPAHDAVSARQEVIEQLELELEQLRAMLAAEQAAEEPDAEQVAELRASITETETELDAQNVGLIEKIDQASACEADCASNYDAQVAACVADCKPCSYAPNLNCTGGVTVRFDGTPVFFPVDDVTGATSDRYEARLADYFGYAGWPSEDDIFSGAPRHNFFFTTELSYSFRFDSARAQVLRFMGDDDLWVFINGKLAVDLGGVHTPASGEVVLDAAAASAYGLASGETYPIKVFHADRSLDGSSLLVTMPGSGAYSVCTKQP